MKTGRAIGFMLTGLLATTLLLEAKPVTPEEALAAAQGWVALQDGAPAGGKAATAVSSVKAFQTDAGRTLCYVAALEPSGAVVFSADDAIEPVIAFTGGALDLSDPDPCNHLRMMLENDMPDRLADAEGVKGPTVKAGKWALLMAAATDPEGVKGGLGSVWDVRVGPLVSTRWSQSYVYQGYTKLACYNYFTPKYTAGSYQNYVCGCVATALAQILRYHRRPAAGVGTASYTIQVDGGNYTRALKGGNGSGGRYSWDSMPDDPAGLARGGKLSVAQRQAIGYLCHDAGVASHMSYGYGSSSAVLCTSEGSHPLQTVFRFASVDSPWVASGTTFLKKDINTAINPCLDAGLPSALAIRADKGGVGHAIVADGYGYAYGSLYHHLNMGWSGTDDAWYNLPVIGTPSRTYLRVDGLVFNIHPTRENLSIISGRILDAAGKPLSGVKVVARDNSGVYPNRSGYTNGRGIYALLVDPGQYTVTGSLTGYGFKPDEKNVTAGYGATRNSWFNNFTRCTRIMRLSSTWLGFGQVTVGETKTLRFKVFNDGTASMKVTDCLAPPEYTISPLPPFNVAPNGGYQAVDVTFTPTAAGYIKDSLILKSNKSGGVSTLTVAGSGIAPPG